jgi:hypothetical protein
METALCQVVYPSGRRFTVPASQLRPVRMPDGAVYPVVEDGESAFVLDPRATITDPDGRVVWSPIPLPRPSGRLRPRRPGQGRRRQG